MKSFRIKVFLSRWVSLLAFALLASCGGSSDDSLPFVFSATLTGAEETPPNASTARGIGILIFYPNDRTFHVRAVSTGMADNAAHIHEGAPGVAGPIVIPLTRGPGSAVWEATGTLTPEQEAALRDGNINYYFNIHSPSFPEGEIRGQIAPRGLSPEQWQRVEQQWQELIAALRPGEETPAIPPTPPVTPPTPPVIPPTPPVTPPTPPVTPPTPPVTPPTPETPATPATPAIPATPATPATPGTPATPATPAMPATPATPATPARPATPAIPY